MNKKTRKASKELTIVANVIFTCGLIIGSIVVILGVFSITTGQNSNFSGVLSLSGISAIIVGIIIMLWHYVLYAVLEGFSALVANSDRGETINAMYELNDTLKKYMESNK
ncbi:hypothetical protein SAMN04487831_10815 [Pseudobutyrivibrio sp. UC1225]|uniref:hypothetical protein n=1 Tax=Pseudobutyrivibrio sp. UC1225 TaxID=1798185 RepID=UPI0008EBA671|nr:hypothetical protein [Pseudobutyrivibrio sp. UC1225]SFO09371.1 hypothetical protein SAMN04487831_10815 [Pseudobutyrivibrio sp. UC1225]